MKILTDEHVSPAVANTLRSEGIDAVTIYETPIIGEDDPDVLAFANENRYVVLTNHQDFVTGEFIATTDHRGVLFYEDQHTSRRNIVRSVRNALSVLRAEDVRNEIIYLPDDWI
jgi:predicted nuclease of predicted toxin-antitoxin system